MESELLETMLDDFKSELTNRLDGTMKHSDIRIAYLKKAIDAIQNELRKNMMKSMQLNCKCGNTLSEHQESDLCGECYWHMRAGLFTCSTCQVFYCKQEEHAKIRRHIAEHDDSTFNAVVVSQEDFKDNWELTDEEFELVWQIAQNKMPDMLMQDLDIIMQEIVDRAIEELEKHD